MWRAKVTNHEISTKSWEDRNPTKFNKSGMWVWARPVLKYRYPCMTLLTWLTSSSILEVMTHESDVLSVAVFTWLISLADILFQCNIIYDLSFIFSLLCRVWMDALSLKHSWLELDKRKSHVYTWLNRLHISIYIRYAIIVHTYMHIMLYMYT